MIPSATERASAESKKTSVTVHESIGRSFERRATVGCDLTKIVQFGSSSACQCYCVKDSYDGGSNCYLWKQKIGDNRHASGKMYSARFSRKTTVHKSYQDFMQIIIQKLMWNAQYNKKFCLTRCLQDCFNCIFFSLKLQRIRIFELCDAHATALIIDCYNRLCQDVPTFHEHLLTCQLASCY